MFMIFWKIFVYIKILLQVNPQKYFLYIIITRIFKKIFNNKFKIYKCFFGLYDRQTKQTDFVINLEILITWFRVRNSTIKNTLINSYTNNRLYDYKRKIVRMKTKRNNIANSLLFQKIELSRIKKTDHILYN